MKEKFIVFKDKIMHLINREKIINLKDKSIQLLKDNKKISLIVIAILLFIIFFITIFNNTNKEVPLSGNLNNYGIAVENDNWIYYVSSDKSGIYRVKSNSSKMKQVTTEYGIFLNCDGEYIYYLNEDNDIIRMKLNGKKQKVLIEDVDRKQVTVTGGKIYYSKNGNFYRAKTNGKNIEKILNKTIYSYQIIDNWIYYSYKNDDKYVIAKMKNDGTKSQKILSDAATSFCVDGKWIYYLMEKYDFKNYEYNYALYKVKENGEKKERISVFNGNIDTEFVNMNEDGVYYIKEIDWEYGIYFMTYKGKETYITSVERGTFINVVGKWIFYLDKNEIQDKVLYRIKTNGKDKQELAY